MRGRPNTRSTLKAHDASWPYRTARHLSSQTSGLTGCPAARGYCRPAAPAPKPSAGRSKLRKYKNKNSCHACATGLRVEARRWTDAAVGRSESQRSAHPRPVEAVWDVCGRHIDFSKPEVPPSVKEQIYSECAALGVVRSMAVTQTTSFIRFKADREAAQAHARSLAVKPDST